MIRAFVAVELPDSLRRQIAGVQQDLRERLARRVTEATRIAWARPASMHLTLKFLGDIDEARVEALREAIARAAKTCEPVDVPFGRLGAFPRPQEPRTLWIGAPLDWQGHPDAGRLAGLVGAIDDGCAPFGVPREPRPFTPHLTLARIKQGERQAGRALAGLGALDRAVPVGLLALHTVTLMTSQLDSAGAVHSRLWAIRLGAVS